MEVFIDIVIHILVPIMVLTFLTFVVILIVNRLSYEIFKFRIKLAKAKIDIFLTSLIFSPLDEIDFAIAINNFKQRVPFDKNWCKEIILNEIINLNQNLKGDVKKSIHFIYEQFNLFDYSLQFLKRKEWYIKSLGIYHFQALGYTKGESYVRPYLTSKNKILSSNAYIALIALTSDKLDFLCDYPNPISLTSEIKIMDILHSRKPTAPTNLKDWINSKNPSIAKLGIKFMVYYNNTSYTKEIIKLLRSEHKSIRKEVIIAARDLFIEDAEQILINQFQQEDKKNKIEILNTLAAIGTEISEKYIGSILVGIADTDIKLTAVYSLNAIRNNYFDTSFKDNQEIIKMVKHVKSPYI